MATIREQNEEEDDSLSEGTVDLRKIYSLWEIMKRYELY